MWEKIKELRLILSFIIISVTGIVSIIGWTTSNIVFAGDFNQFKLEQSLKWLNYDEQRLRSEYYDLRNLRKQSPRDRKRLSDVETKLDHATAERLQLEKELRGN